MHALPDTKLVVEARNLLEAAAPPAIASHSLRTFLLGKTVGEKRQLEFDEESLALAALFHDLGLCGAHRTWRAPFPIVSARLLREHLRSRGVDEARITPMAEAIEFHMQLFPRWSHGPVAGLLQIGAWMDVMRRGRSEISSQADAIEAAHPRSAPPWTQILPVALSPIGCVGYLLPEIFR